MEQKVPDFKFNTVMLIDDSELDNYISEKIIENNRFAKRIYSNTSAKSALEFLHNMNIMGNTFVELYPKVIFIDINMPMMDGFQFIEFFEKSAEENLFKPKLVILTSSVYKEDKLLALEVSEDVMFLNKPLTTAMLDAIWTES